MKRHFIVLIIAVTAVQSDAADENKVRPRQTSHYTVGPSIQPLVIYGEGWSQQFTIINVDYYQGGERIVGTLRFYTQGGQPWRIPLKGVGATDQAPVNLASGQMLMLETEVSQQAQQLGWAHLDTSLATGSSGIYHAFATYRKQTAGAPDLMTAVPFVDDLEDEVLIPFDNTGSKYPGVGLVNANTTSGSFTMDVYDTAGRLRKTIRKTIGAKGLTWFSLVGENPDLAGIAGQIKLRGPLFRAAALTLQFAPNGAFTALPVVHTFGMQ